MLTKDDAIALAREAGLGEDLDFYPHMCNYERAWMDKVLALAQLADARAQAATLATVTPLVQLALEELDGGLVHAEDCMKNYGSNYHCRCQKPATLAKLRAFLSGATKESTDHG